MAHGKHLQNERLAALIGEWSMAMILPGQPTPAELPNIGARVSFEWMGDHPRRSATLGS